MPSVPTAVEVCPKCKTSFTAAPHEKRGRSSKYKTCPQGHESSVYQLFQERRKSTAAPDGLRKEGEEPAMAARRFTGIHQELDAFRSLATSLVACYDRLIATTPARVHGVIDGVFGSTIKMAKRMLGVV